MLWLLRDADLTRDHLLAAESVELVDDSLRRIGARRSFDKRELIRLHDLLWKRDQQGILAGLLEAAEAAGSLDPLRDTEALPDGYLERSLELADLLDPDVATVASDW